MSIYILVSEKEFKVKFLYPQKEHVNFNNSVFLIQCMFFKHYYILSHYNDMVIIDLITIFINLDGINVKNDHFNIHIICIIFRLKD